MQAVIHDIRYMIPMVGDTACVWIVWSDCDGHQMGPVVHTGAVAIRHEEGGGLIHELLPVGWPAALLEWVWCWAHEWQEALWRRQAEA
jgi:hypothetical protein